jgi:sugar/nucleoside kinase (ribokinase family)
MPLLIIGGVTIDILHLPGRTEPVTAAGGAGMYTALAAARTCAGHRTPTPAQAPAVTLFAQRPHPLPELLRPLTHIPWIGPEIPPDELPRLEIAHYGGGKAALLHAYWGAQAHLTPDALPEDLSAFNFIHLAVMVSPQRQLEFLDVCRARSRARNGGLISAGTNGKNASGEPEKVHALIQQTDLFFMNENEANALFGRVENARPAPGKCLLITLGERGALVLIGDACTEIPALPVREVDPTGAGDTFCGATLAGLAHGLDAVSAAREGVRLAGEMIQAIGPAALLPPTPLLPSPPPPHHRQILP